MRDLGLQLAIDFERAMDARELGIQRSGDHADAVESGWRYQALALLGEAYRVLVGRELEEAHTAKADAIACAELYWAIKDLTAACAA